MDCEHCVKDIDTLQGVECYILHLILHRPEKYIKSDSGYETKTKYLEIKT